MTERSITSRCISNIMRTFVTILLVACCTGCSVTLTGSARWSEAGPEPTQPPNKELQAQIDKMTGEIRAFVTDLKTAPNELEANDAVLKRYGIERKATTQTP